MAFRQETIGECTLYLGDCLEVLPTLGKVGAVFVDPPYDKEAHRPTRRTMSSIRTGEDVSLDFVRLSPELRDGICRESMRLCDGWFLCFCQAEQVGEWRDALEAEGAKYKRPMIWVKPDSAPQFNGQMPAIGFESMALAWMGCGRSHWNGGGRRGVFVHPTNNPDRHGVHKTEKPASLMRELVSLFTSAGDTVLDPCMGSGTTGVACVKLGRKFIGVEIEERYFQIACERIYQATRQPRLDLPEPVKPEQAGLALPSPEKGAR